MTLFRYFLTASLLFAVLLSQPSVAKAQKPLLIKVNPGKKRQKMFGFGCGTVFYSNGVLHQKESDRAKICDWLWNDLEMNLLMYQTRFDLEETNDNDDPFVLDRSKLNYERTDWVAGLLKEAKKRRGEDMVFIATLYSPPVWLKDNAEIRGGGVDLSKEVNFLEIAEFVYAWLDRLKTEHGIDTHYLTLANEPDFNHKQPGAKWSPLQLALATDVTVNHLRELVKKTPGMVMPKIIAANTLSVRAAGRYMEAIAENRGAKKNTDVVGYHLYDSSVNQRHYEKLQKFRIPMWVTEWTGPRDMPEATKTPLTLSLGQMVGRIKAMHGGSSVIMHFELAHPKSYAAGVFQGGSRKLWTRDTPYYVWQQMVNQTPQGDKAWMVDSSVFQGNKTWHDRIAAYTDTKKRRTTIHLVNDANTSAGDVVISLSGRKIKSATGFRTSGDENHVQLADEDVQFSRDRVSVALPKYSFVTLQIEHR